MSKKATLTDVSTGYQSAQTFNDSLNAINDKLDNTLSRDGSTPNAMGANLDMNGNEIINAGSVDTNTLTLSGQNVTAVDSVFTFRGAWSVSTAYQVNDVVTNEGSAYICAEDHTSSIFTTDLAADRWITLAAKGEDGSDGAQVDQSNTFTLQQNFTANPAVFVGNDTAATVILEDTNYTSTHNQSRIIRTGNIFTWRTYGDGGSLVSVDYVSVAGASGVTIHRWQIQDSQVMELNTAGLDIDTPVNIVGDTDITGNLTVSGTISGAASPALVFIESQDASDDAELTFTGFDDTEYDGYLFLFGNIEPATDGAQLQMQTSKDGGSNYDSGTSDYAFYIDFGLDVNIQTVNNEAFIRVSPQLGTATGEEGFSGRMECMMPHLSKRSRFTYQGWGDNPDGTGTKVEGCAQRKETDVVDAVRFYMDTGNIAAGTITMYGYRNS